MPNLNDQQHDQFLRLFAEHEPALRTFIRSLLPSRGDALEVIQEVAVVLWQKFAEFDATRDFRKWAFGVARYEALAYLRDRARDRHVFDDELVGRLADEAAVAAQRHEAQREALDTGEGSSEFRPDTNPSNPAPPAAGGTTGCESTFLAVN
jgi:RNA polymerase sigma-70 factor (ECF subfamily)